MRRFAISDIHGCLSTFKALLETIEFSKKDVLYLLGDYIDRGPDSKGVIDHIWKLQDEGYLVFCLRGNHEQMLLEELSRERDWGGGDFPMLRSFEATRVEDIPKKYIKWIRGLDYFFEVEEYILTHAGLNFKLTNPLEGLVEMMWIRGWHDKIDREWLGHRIIVHGHTPTSRIEIENSWLQLKDLPVIVIDSGCVYNYPGMAHLCALDLTNRRLYFQERTLE